MRKRKLILIFISLFILFSLLAIKKSLAIESGVPLEKDLSGQKVLFLYLKVNPAEKKVYLDKIEAKYGFAPENNTPTNQVIEVIKNGETVYQSSFQIDVRVDIFSPEGQIETNVNSNLQPRDELVVIPYVNGADIFIKDRNTNNGYLLIKSQKIESLSLQENLRKDYEDKIKRKAENKEDKVVLFRGGEMTGTPISSLNLLTEEAQKKEEIKKENPISNFFDWFKNWLNKLVKSFKEFLPTGKVKGVKSQGKRELKILYISKGFTSQDEEEEEKFRRVASQVMSQLSQTPPFNEFNSSIFSFVVFTPDLTTTQQAQTQYPHNLLVTIYKGTGRSYAFFGDKVVLFEEGRENLNVISHEVGHAFAGLLDEYTGNPYSTYDSGSPKGANCSSFQQTSNGSSCNKWPGHACYQGCSHENWGRYNLRCLMRDMFSPFCEVCQNQIRNVFNGGPIIPEAGFLPTPLPTAVPSIKITSVLTPISTVTVKPFFSPSPTLKITITQTPKPTGTKPTATPTISIPPFVTPTLTPPVIACSGVCYGSPENCQTNCGQPCRQLTNNEVINICQWPSGSTAFRCCRLLPTTIPSPTLAPSPTPSTAPTLSLTPSLPNCSDNCYASPENCQTNCGQPCVRLDDNQVQSICHWPSGSTAFRCCNLPTETPVGNMSTYTGECNFSKMYNRNWVIISPPIKKGEQVYLSTQGTTNSSAGNSKGRFRINGTADIKWCQGEGLTLTNNWCETILKYNHEFYLPYTFNTTGRYVIESMIFNINIGWY